VRVAIKVSRVFAPTTGLRRGFNLGFHVEPPEPKGRRPVRPLDFDCVLTPGWRGRARCAIRVRSTPGCLLTGLQPEEPSTGGFIRLARSRSPKPPGFGAGEARLECGSTPNPVARPKGFAKGVGMLVLAKINRAAEPGAGAKTRLTRKESEFSVRFRMARP
jgi:hypothetical protein